MGSDADPSDAAAADAARAPPGGADGGAVAINVRCSNGSKIAVAASLGSTIGAFKSALARDCDVPADQQRLIYKGRILKDDQTLASYGLQADHTVHMVRGSPPSAGTPPSAAPGAGSGNSASGVTSDVASDEGAGAGLGATLFGAPNLFGAGFPEIEQVHQQLTQNPDMMREIMNMPSMQNLMNNPDLMHSLIMGNPQMREIIDRNPELAHILNDPGILRQTLEVARNPELMREMMRNTDRAMSNIEASPEGFNMLRRMYENVQEPFLNATTMGGNGGNDSSSNPFAALLRSQGGSQVRDGTNPPSSVSSEATAGLVPNTSPLPNPWGNTGGGTQTNNTTRSNTATNTQPPSIAGLGNLNFPQMDEMFSSSADVALLNQLMQNPALSQMMQSVFSDPQYINQIISLNPQLRSMVDMNPPVREMLQNPELLRQLTSPETMQQMLALQRSVQSISRPQSNQGQGQTGETAGTPTNAGIEQLMNMFGGLGAGTLTPSVPDVPPEELYATQLSQLQEMGFFDTQENIRALRATSGNVHAAVDRLLMNLGQ
ncbi:ubiquitin domain-containing protein DSK2a-like isoform X2 [Syzygium oleosum]|uniref:ubiquitin domain-containing protein DSK2a-like isoform X2 n=1 Tax=Syzygium oleosum TaxID=219896 RepID=UPI0024B8F487|nr:ubiquitin domain-containing protein DSK2a-like isoform X2 [Syzygium oleosum]